MANNNSNLYVVINGQSKPLVEAVDQATVALEKLVGSGNVSFDDLKIASENMSLSASASLQRLYDQGKITADGMKAAGLEISNSLQGVASKAPLSADETIAALKAETIEVQKFQKAAKELNATPVEPKVSGGGILGGAGEIAAGMAIFSAAYGVYNKLQDVVKAGSQAFIDYQKQIVAVTEGLKSSHDAHKITTSDIEQFSAAQEKATGITKNQNLAVAATLLNFKNINADQLPKYIKLVDDAAATMDHGVPSANRLASVAGIVGKALERPNNVAQALGRSLGDLSQEQIKAIHDHYNLSAAADKTSNSLSNMATASRHGAEQIARDQETIAKKTKAVQDAQANLAKAQSEQYVDESFRQAAIAKAHDKVTAATQALSDAQTRLGSHQQDLGDKMTAAQARAAKGTQEHNDLAGAQELLYEDLAGIVGGRAASATDTLAGKQALLNAQFQDTAIAIGQKLKAAWDAIYPGLLDFGNWVLAHKEVIIALAGAIGGLLVMALKAAAANILKAGLAFGQAALAASPWLLIGAAVAVLAYEIITHWDQVKGFFEALWKSVSTWAQDAWSAVQGAWLGAVGWFSSIWKSIGDAISNVFKAVGSIFTGVFQVIGAAINQFRTHAFEDIGFVIGFILTLPFKVLAAIIYLGVQLVILFYQMWNSAAKAVSDAISGAITWLMSINWGNVFANIGLAILNVGANIWDGITSAWTRTINWITHINWGSVLMSAITAIANFGVDIWNAISGAWNKVMGLDWGKILINIGKGLANAIIDLINGAIKGAFSGVPVLKDHVPQIPHFALGVTNFAGGLALLGEEGPELAILPRGASVLPASETRQYLSSGGSATAPSSLSNAQTVSLTVQVMGNYMGSTADRQKLATQLWQELQRIERQHGMGGSLPNIGVLPV